MLLLCWSSTILKEMQKLSHYFFKKYHSIYLRTHKIDQNVSPPRFGVKKFTQKNLLGPGTLFEALCINKFLSLKIENSSIFFFFFFTISLISHLAHLYCLSFWYVHIVFLSRFCSSLIEPHFQNEFCKLVLPSQHHCLPTYLADSDTDRKFPGSMYSLCANFVSFPLKLVIYKV